MTESIIKPVAMTYKSISLKDIEPDTNQPRKKKNEQADKELKESMGLHGLIQPIVVRTHGNKYIIVVGERRWRCANELAWENIDCGVMSGDHLNENVLQMIENIQREDLSAEDMANHLNVLMKQFKEEDEKATMRALASITGKSLGWISEKLALARLPDEVKALKDNKTVNNSRVLIGLSRLKKKNPESAANIIKQVEGGKKITVDLINRAMGRVRKKSEDPERESVDLTGIGTPESVVAEMYTDSTKSGSESPAGALTEKDAGGSVVIKQEDADSSHDHKRVKRTKKVIEVATILGIKNSEEMSTEDMLEAFAEALLKTREEVSV